MRLSAVDSDEFTTRASLWRIIFSPAGPGHVLYLTSELTDDHLRIYSDNIALARWLQETVQGMLSAESRDLSVPVMEAEFSQTGDMRSFWTERVSAAGEEIALTWYDTGDPLLVNTERSEEHTSELQSLMSNSYAVFCLKQK